MRRRSNMGKLKLEKELEALILRLRRLDTQKIMTYKAKLRQSRGYNDFNTRFAWDVLRMCTHTEVICDWYEKYDCHDSHINTLAIKACKQVGFLE